MGGKRLLDQNTQVKLDEISIAKAEKSAKKLSLRRDLERQLKANLHEDDLIISRLANEALLMGAPKSEILRSLGTSSWSTLQDLLELTAVDFANVIKVEKYDIIKKRWYTFDPNTGLFHVPDVEKMRKWYDFLSWAKGEFSFSMDVPELGWSASVDTSDLYTEAPGPMLMWAEKDYKKETKKILEVRGIQESEQPEFVYDSSQYSQEDLEA